MFFVLDIGLKCDYFDLQFIGEISKLNIRYKYVIMCIFYRYKMREREREYLKVFRNKRE